LLGAQHEDFASIDGLCVMAITKCLIGVRVVKRFTVVAKVLEQYRLRVDGRLALERTGE
jgi:hypothetical protein